MNFKVVRKNGAVVCFSPNDGNYEPTLKAGEVVTVENTAPLPPAPDPKAEAQAYLDATDWYVVRFAETGVPVPAEVTTKRAAARALLP